MSRLDLEGCVPGRCGETAALFSFSLFFMPSPLAPPVRILVVEDREEDFGFISLLLGRSHLRETYELDWAPSFDEGLARLRAGRYDAGLFDYKLGSQSGLELLQKAVADGVEMPIILLTGMDSAQVDEEALRVGAADYLCKIGLNGIQLERAIRYARRQFHVQSELRRTSNLLNSVLSQLPVIAGRLDRTGTILEARGRGLRSLGIHENALVGLNVPLELPSVAGSVKAALAGGRSEFTTAFDQGGVTYHFDNYLHFDDTRGEGAIGFSVDVTSRVAAEQEGKRQAQLLQSILRSLPVVAGRLGANGVVLEAEGEGLSEHRLSPRHLLGRSLPDLFPQSRGAVQKALSGGSASFTLGNRQAEEEWSVDFFVSFDTERGDGATFLGRDLTERRRLERQLLTAADAEQQRIGADLHDGLGQELTGLACLATALRDRLRARVPAEAEQAELIARLANEATVKSRALAHGLSPVTLEVHGLASALEDLVLQSQRLHGIECQFSLRGESPEVDHLAAIHLYRIAQEAIHNAVKHGNARHVHVGLISRPSRHRLLILDNGAGFDAHADSNHGGRGLRLMSYRANMLGGTLSVRSALGSGSRVYCEWNRPNPAFYEN